MTEAGRRGWDQSAYSHRQRTQRKALAEAGITTKGPQTHWLRHDQRTDCISPQRLCCVCAGAIDEADIAVEGLEAAVAALERLTQMLAYNCREDVTYGLRVCVRLSSRDICTTLGLLDPAHCTVRSMLIRDISLLCGFTVERQFAHSNVPDTLPLLAWQRRLSWPRYSGPLWW